MINFQPVVDASVLVSTYNRPEALEVVLAALADQLIAPKEILVADDGSEATTASVVKRWIERGLPITHCWQEDLGFRKAAALNEAIAKVRTPYCIFLDGDCVPLPGFVRDHLGYSEVGHVLAGPRILANPKFTQRIERSEEKIFHRDPGYWLLRRLLGEINRLSPFIRLPNGEWRKAKPQQWKLFRGCNFSVATDALLAVDGFDENITGWGLEDSDLAIRLINAGIKIKTLRFAAPVLHLWHQEESREFLQQNQAHLDQTIRSKRIRAVKGISSHTISQ